MEIIYVNQKGNYHSGSVLLGHFFIDTTSISPHHVLTGGHIEMRLNVRESVLSDICHTEIRVSFNEALWIQVEFTCVNQ